MGIRSKDLIRKLVCCVAVGFCFSQPGILSADDTDARKFASIKDDVDAFVKRARTADTDSQRVNATIDCILLYCQIRTDPRFSRSPYLQQMANLVSARLSKVEKELQRELIKLGNTDPNAAVKSMSSLKNDEIEQELAAKQAMVNSLELSVRLNGGLEGVFERSSGYYGGGAVNDYGDDLIRLIQDVIHPDSWEVNGGTGRISYYSPSMALVVRATTEVHEDLSRLLMILRAMM
jgi:hypothetical protein